MKSQKKSLNYEELIKGAAENRIVLHEDNNWIDHSIPDSFRIYVEYEDSSSIFGVFTYSRRFVIDQVAPIQINY